jgi:transcription elongation factor GreA
MELEEMVKRAEVAGPSGGAAVSIGSKVTAVGPNGERTLHIVGATEANPSDGSISHESPLGKAFLGHRVGDEVVVATPAGTSTYTIKQVR